MGNYKMCDILQIAGRSAKRSKIWASGRVLLAVKSKSVTLLLIIQCHFEVIWCIPDFFRF